MACNPAGRASPKHDGRVVDDALPVGAYSELVTEALDALLADDDLRSRALVARLRDADAGDRLGRHLGSLVARSIGSLSDTDRANAGAVLVERLIEALEAYAPSTALRGDRIAPPARILEAVRARRPDGQLAPFDLPLTPLLDTTVLTNARGEPTIQHELAAEVPSASSIDVVMAFVRWSGVRPLLPALRRHREEGRRVRLITTTYTDSTEARALDELSGIGVEVRVSYDTTTTRLHAKAWVFHRHRGATTAYIGSSNLTHSAQVTGLEWNVRVSGLRNPDVVAKMAAVFESYWESDDFVPYVHDEFVTRTNVVGGAGPQFVLPPTELHLRPFQERLLEQIEVGRRHGHHRNLLVAATGTGKTVMAAVDYARLRSRLPRARLLFVAHRREILEQSRATFRHALRDAAFGELWVGQERPQRFDHVFASIQTLNAVGLAALDPRHFDVVVVDEFHHAAAPSYSALLEHVEPLELLGLTATPERTDGLDVLTYFDGRIAAELRVWDAIDQQYLVPFAYYGVHDGLDLTQVPWRRGQGYDVDALTNVYTANDIWVGQLVNQLRARVTDVGAIRAIGFCVSVEHARFMARQFEKRGIAARAVWGDSTADERRSALRDLADGNVAVLFTVDLFNEGVDVPNVDTLLLLRPTESATLFLQQLGRGLRRAVGKSECTVLDFVGIHRREFRFDLRYRALLGGTRHDLQQQVEQNFPFLPAGCHFELDPVARDIVLASIRNAIPTRWPERVAELRSIGDVPLSTFLTHSGLDLDDVYATIAAGASSVGPPGCPQPPQGRARLSCFAPSAGFSTLTMTSASRDTEPSRPTRNRSTSTNSTSAVAVCSACSSRRCLPTPLTRVSMRRSRDYALIPRCAASSSSCSMCLMRESITYSRCCPHRRTYRCICTPATPVSRSKPRSTTAPRCGRLAGTAVSSGCPTSRPTSSPSRSTRPAASSHPQRAIRTTPSARS